MMRRKITALLMSIFFISLITAIVIVNVNRPRILVLHSYDKSYAWTREINVGLTRALESQSWIQVRYHYMNTKKKSGPEHLRRAGIAARKAINDIQPDVVIAIDDYAQKLVGSKFVNDQNVQIVFAGVNGSAKPYGYLDAKNVTGIYERKPVEAIREAIMLLAPALGKDLERGDTVSTTMVADTTLSAQRDGDFISSYNWAPVIYKKAHFVKHFDEWKETIQRVSKEVDFIMVGGYRKLKRSATSGPKEKYVPHDEVMRWTEKNSAAPVIGINVFNTEDGAMLSVGVSPYEQGGSAAKMARQIIDKKITANKIPIKTSQQYVVSFRRSALDRRKLAVPKIFEAFARATDNYFD